MSASGPQVSRDIPILFSGPMVSALLDGRKTQTRRLIKQPRHKVPSDATARWTFGYKTTKADPPWMELSTPLKFGNQIHHIFRVPARVGDRLWVKEAFRIDGAGRGVPAAACRGKRDVQYRADGYTPIKYDERSPIHMPRWASRLTLTVTDVRVQRLQDISDDDVIAEGLQIFGGGERDERDVWRRLVHSAVPGHENEGWLAPEAYAALWAHLHGKDSWATNPWVCAISFSVERRNIDAKVAG